MTNSTQSNRNDALDMRDKEEREMPKSKEIKDIANYTCDACSMGLNVARRYHGLDCPRRKSGKLTPANPAPACHCGGAERIAELEAQVKRLRVRNTELAAREVEVERRLKEGGDAAN